MERFARLWQADRRAVCAGAATGLALSAHVKAGLPLNHRWDATRWAGLCAEDGRPDGPRLTPATIKGRNDRFVCDARRVWGPRVISLVLGALVERGIRIHRTGLARKGDAAAVSESGPLAASATGPP